MFIKVQKILMFIPIINIIPAFCWIIVGFKHGMTVKESISTGLKMCLSVLAVNVIRMILSLTLKNDVLDQIAFWVAAYLSLLLVALFAIKAQEKFLNKQKEDTPTNENDK